MPETTPAPADRVAAYLAEARELPGKRREMLANWWAVDGMDLAEVTEDLIRRLPCLVAAVEAVTRLHREHRIYEPCDHEHTDEDVREGGAVDAGDFLSCHDCYVFSVCRECCTGGVSQTEGCASDHDHSACWPCPTYLAITTELLTEEGHRG